MRALNFAITLLAIITILEGTANAALTNFTSCYLYNNDVSDLSFTYSDNEARIAAHSRLINDFQVDLLSNAYSSINTVANITDRLIQLVTVDGCRLVVVTWVNLLGASFDLPAFARQFPKTVFAERTEGKTVANPPSNYVNYVVQTYQATFCAGAVASQQASTCVGLIFPQTSQTWLVNSFYRGMLWANRSTALYAVALGSDGDAVQEQQLVDLFVKKGCEVMMSMTTTNTVPTYVASLSATGIMSIGFGAHSSLTAGDTAITSVYLDLTNLFYNISQDAIHYLDTATPLVGTYFAQKSTENILADVSPEASPGIVALAAQARAFIDLNDASCATFVDTNGGSHSGCLTESQKLSYPYLDNRVHLLSSWKPTTFCPAGYRYTYTASDFSISCEQCPQDHLSTAGSSACLPCAAGLVSNPGSSSCALPRTSSFSLLLVIPIVIGALVGTTIIIIVIMYVFRVTVEPSRDARHAPHGPDVVIAMIGVDGARSDRQWRASLTNMCDVYDRLAAVVNPIANKYKAYIFVSVGDVVMISMSNPHDLIAVLHEIHLAAGAVRWPCQIRLKMVMHSGQPTIGENKRQGTDDDVRVTYSGPDVDLVRALWRRDAACDVTVTSHTVASVDLTAHEISQPIPFVVEEKNIHTTICSINFALDENAQDLAAANPLDVSLPPLEPDTDSSKGRNGGSSGSEFSEVPEDDLSRLVTPSTVTKDELEALRSLGVDLLQKFLRVFSFDDQVSIVMAIAKKLHVQAPKIPEMKITMKKSFNVLRNSLKQICNQLLMSMDEKELQSWLQAVHSHVQKREMQEGAKEDDPAPASRMQQ